MTLIKINDPYIKDDMLRSLTYFRQNPLIAVKYFLMRDGEPLELMPIQAAILEEWWHSSTNILTASRGMGKAVINSTKVLTPKGWERIDRLKVGEEVITPTGITSKIVGVYPQGKVPTYKVTFKDGRVIYCCKDHLWTVKGYKCRNNKWTTTTSKEIKEWKDKYSSTSHHCVRIPLVEGGFLQRDTKKLYLHPYVLGALLGDGGLTHHVGFSSKDLFIVNKIKRLLPKNVTITSRGRYSYAIIHKKRKFGFKPTSKKGCIPINELKEWLKEAGLQGKKSNEKSIPPEYMNLNREQTLQLLRGLFDTGGTVGVSTGRNKKRKFHGASYCTTSTRLSKQIQKLIWRLGGICRISEKLPYYTNLQGKKVKGLLAYNLNVRCKNKKELFSLPRKANLLSDTDQYSEHLSLIMDKIEESLIQECTCIEIEDKKGLFVVDNYIVTHNSFLASVYFALKCMLYPSQMLGCFGPSFRQSKVIFNEFNLIYNESPLLQECVSKPPTLGNDQAICIFKPAGPNIRPSSIKALPVGTDGKKIRGNRFTEFFLDECVQLPESIFRSVIRPMISTDINPAKSVRRVKELKEVYGEDIPDQILNTSTNGYTVITSGYYQFNYWWAEIKRAWEAIQAGSKDHSLRFVPYYDLPEGFMNMRVVNQAKDNDPKHVFLTEWCAEWIADSEGAFPMSLLEAARDAAVIPKLGRDQEADKGKRYVFGIDIARERDSTAVVVIELGMPSKVVFISELEEMPFPKQAQHIFDLIYRFDPMSIFMDAFGGGKTIKDLLASPESVGVSPSMKVISKDENIYHTGKRILQMCIPTSEFLEDANNNTKTLLEQRALRLPSAIHPIESIRKKGNKNIDLVQEMINQVASVVITPTALTGRLRYDLPKTKSSQNSEIQLDARKKDLYSAFILAGYGAYMLAYRPVEDKKMIQRGVIKETVKDPYLPSKTKTGQSLGGYTISNSGIINHGSTDSKGNTKHVIQGGGIIITRNGRK